VYLVIYSVQSWVSPLTTLLTLRRRFYAWKAYHLSTLERYMWRSQEIKNNLEQQFPNLHVSIEVKPEFFRQREDHTHW
jgi:hypothetical protein